MMSMIRRSMDSVHDDQLIYSKTMREEIKSLAMKCNKIISHFAMTMITQTKRNGDAMTMNMMTLTIMW